MNPKVATLSKSKKAFFITCNEEDKFGDVLNYLRSLSPNYLLACKEKAPTTGHVHMHAYVQFLNARRLSFKKLLGSHLDECRGSAQQNITYVKKDGDILTEEGEPRLKGGYTIAEVKKMKPEERELLPFVYSNLVNKLNSEEAKMIKGSEYFKEVEVYWYWGESGSGKTRYAISQIADNLFNEVKYDGSFWHGVTEKCDVCLYDDFRDNHMKPTELINFIDYNRHVMNVKGGTIRNNYKKIYITSLQDPEKIYANVPEESRKQWLRRLKEIIKFEIN